MFKESDSNIFLGFQKYITSNKHTVLLHAEALYIKWADGWWLATVIW